MSNPNKDHKESGSKTEENPENDARSASQPIPSGSNIRYPNEPLQFRVRGSTITGASPPMFVSLEQIMKAAHGIENMALAHEIAVDQDFKLDPFEPPDNSYQKIVKDTLHKAYFDILRSELNSDPPQYERALILLEDVKQGLFSILLPRHTRIKQMIDEVLDTAFIQQQAENNSLDFHKYAAFVIDLMAKLAAPARDEMIQNITKITDTVEIFRAILETLDVLKLDLANTLIAMIRPHVQAESVQYERAKFEELLEMADNGLESTRQWLKRHLDKTDLTIPVTDQSIVRNVTAQTLAKAYMELLEWDQSYSYPETVRLDAPRFSELGEQVYRLNVAAAVLLSAPSPSSSGSSPAGASHKLSLKDRIYIILGNTRSDTELNAILPSVAEEVLQSTEQLLEQCNQAPLTAEMKELIRTQITSLRDREHRVRQIVRQRVLEFLKDILVCGGGTKQVPVGLSVFANELTSTAGTLLRYVMHNKAVFTKYYLEIIEEELSKN